MTAWFLAWGRTARFAVVVSAAALSPSSYTPRSRTMIAKQLYFTAWQVVPGFALFAALLGAVVIDIIVSVARQFGLAQYALELVFRALVLEMLPLVTALFLALRSGAAINTEIALMRVAGELDGVRSGVEAFEREFVPRLAAAAISVMSLTLFACALALLIAYAVMYGFSPWGFAEYTRVVGLVFSPAVLAGLALKCLLFGVAIAVIPIAAGLDATRQMKSAPVAVMGGMVRLFFTLALIEVFALAVKYV